MQHDQQRDPQQQDRPFSGSLVRREPRSAPAPIAAQPAAVAPQPEVALADEQPGRDWLCPLERQQLSEQQLAAHCACCSLVMYCGRPPF